MNKDIKRFKDEGNFIIRYIKSFLHACNGIWYGIKYEHNIIIMILATIVVTFMGFYFHIKPSEWLFILFAVGSVTSMEMVNSSIEATIDLITLEKHPLAKIAKDTASAASLILCVVSLIGGLIIFLPHFI
jgi:undecaprenol kinase